MTRRQLEKLALALRTLGDGLHQAATALQERSEGSEARGSDRIPEDAFIDQSSALVTRKVYLRLAREKSFASKKVGKRVIARWGDVRAALMDNNEHVAQADGEEEALDALRRSVGLQPKVGP
jgi:hypothetical protein